jgi:hypothetical protein
MRSNVRVVMDTNVAATVAELNDILRRPHFDKYVHEAIPSPKQDSLYSGSWLLESRICESFCHKKNQWLTN